MDNTKVNYQNIRLAPTHWTLDVWVCNNKENLLRAFNKRYGASVEYYRDWLTMNQVCNISSIKKSEGKGENYIILNVTSLNTQVLVHEIIHVIFQMNKKTHIDICDDSQEWVAYMTDYLFEYIRNPKNYKEYELP
jgi:hypothetical protein